MSQLIQYGTIHNVQASKSEFLPTTTYFIVEMKVNKEGLDHQERASRPSTVPYHVTAAGHGFRCRRCHQSK